MIRQNRRVRAIVVRVLLVVNVVLTGVLLAGGQLLAVEGLRDCCKEDTLHVKFCCEACCWVTHDCHITPDCGDEQQQ